MHLNIEISGDRDKNVLNNECLIWALISKPSTSRLESTLGNREFHLFPQCFPPFARTYHHFHKIWNYRLLTLSVWKCPKFVIWENVNKYRFRSACAHCAGWPDSIFFVDILNPFPTKPWFLCGCSTSLLKTLWEKLIVTRNFSFSPQCFLPFRRTFRHCRQIQNCCLQTLLIWKSTQFFVWERVKPLQRMALACCGGMFY